MIAAEMAAGSVLDGTSVPPRPVIELVKVGADPHVLDEAQKSIPIRCAPTAVKAAMVDAWLRRRP